jgi:murein DD-endopeptidase MepM/ murein hydrolase activator NlpD
VGRIVDPDVRDDGGLEPMLELGVPAPDLSDNSAVNLAENSAKVAHPESRVEPSKGVGFEVPSVPELEIPNLRSDAVAVPNPLDAPGAKEGFTVKPASPTLTLPQVEPSFTPLPPGVKIMIPVQDAVVANEPARGESRRGVLEESTYPQPQGGSSSNESRLIDFEGLVEDDPKARHSRDVELDLVGAGLLGRPSGAPLPGPSRPAMSPNLVAFFAAVTGVLTVATIIAVAMRFDQGKWAPTPMAPTPSAVATPEAVPSVEVAPKEPPKLRQRNKIPGPYRVKDSASDSSLRVVEGQIGFDPFLKAVEKAGLPLKEAYRVLKAFEKVRPLNNCSKHDKFAFALDRASRKVKAFEYIPGLEEVFQAKEGSDGLLSVQKLDLKIARERVTGAFAVASQGLERAVVEGGFEPALIRAMREAMIGHLSLDELDRGARVRVIAQEVTVLGEFARYATIEAMEIQFPSDRKPLRIYFFDGPKSRGYFDETARAPYEGGWRSPIPNAPITSKFNLKRMHPVLHVIKPHTGMDYGAPMGTPVGACSFGTISFMGWGGPCGNTVKIDHTNDVQTGYCHLSRFAEGLKVGDKVARLQPIGYVGSTGRSTGPHLHFIVKRNGEFVDPESLKLDALRVLPSDERAVFMEHKAQYDARLEAIVLPPLPSGATEAPAKTAPPEGDEEESESPAASGADKAPPPPVSSAEAPPTKAPSASSLYLTDEELLRQQNGSDNGEVSE